MRSLAFLSYSDLGVNYGFGLSDIKPFFRKTFHKTHKNGI